MHRRDSVHPGALPPSTQPQLLRVRVQLVNAFALYNAVRHPVDVRLARREEISPSWIHGSVDVGSEYALQKALLVKLCPFLALAAREL